jgi:hypothetical protein
MLNQVRISLHPRAPEATSGPTCTIRGVELTTLAIPHEAMRQTFSISFEECYEQLERLPRMFIEPDGSFVWPIDSSDDSNSSHIKVSDIKFQWDGQLFDRDGKLLYLDLTGSAPRESFDKILKILGWPATSIVVQLSREAVFLELDEFYRYATAKTE